MIGRTLSHYKVLAEIGRGGMGIVYRARDLKLSRDVALKILPEEALGNATRKQRFVREARAAAALKHPGIAVIYEIDEDAGVTFISMELVEGRKLSEMLKLGKLNASEALTLAVRIGEGLGHAHDRGVVHRDLKPANVMVMEGGRVKLIDFGLAKLLEPAVANELEPTGAGHVETNSGVVMGTLAYMSPEQARGHGVDHRTDIFSFGVLSYEMLTGAAPFRRPNSADTLAALLTESAPPLTATSVPSLGELAYDLDRILQLCLAKNPEDRYDSMNAVVRDLMAVERGWEDGDVTARAILGPTFAASEPRAASIAVLPFTDMSAARDQEYFGEGMAEEIINVLSRIDGLRWRRGLPRSSSRAEAGISGASAGR